MRVRTRPDDPFAELQQERSYVGVRERVRPLHEFADVLVPRGAEACVREIDQEVPPIRSRGGRTKERLCERVRRREPIRRMPLERLHDDLLERWRDVRPLRPPATPAPTRPPRPMRQALLSDKDAAHSASRTAPPPRPQIGAVIDRRAVGLLRAHVRYRA